MANENEPPRLGAARVFRALLRGVSGAKASDA